MQRVISFLVFLLCLTLLPVYASAGWFSDDTLVTIDGNKYTTEDFKSWWKFWQEKDQALPEKPDFYIDWLLLKDEADRMDMGNAPGFKRQELIFRKSRGLMLLKNEEIDSKIEVTDADVEARYKEQYVPRWLVQELKFTNEESALVAWQDYSEEEVPLTEILERSIEENGPMSYGERWLSPARVDPAWADVFLEAEIGKLIDPETHKNGKSLFVITKTDNGTPEDFAKLKEPIKKKMWRDEEDRLTAQLVKNLMEEYEVKVDEEKLAALDLRVDENELTDEPVITSTKENVSEKQFIQIVRRLQKIRPRAAMAVADEKVAASFKEEAVNNIVAQSVTNWRALDRHFEKEEPFKSSYEFNYNYRMVSMLEQQLFQLKEELTDAEVDKLYQEKIKFYTIPAQVKMYIVDEKQGPIVKIWAEVAAGKDFQQATRELVGRPIKPLETPLNHLDPQVREVVEKLSEGETSQIFQAQGVRAVVHLLTKTPEKPMPLKQAKKSLLSGFKRESFDKAKAAYLDALKANSSIEVDEGNWKSIQKELGGA